MKTIAFHRAPGEPVVMPLSIDIVVDSALVMPDKPLFLPDFTDRWSAMLYPAYRVSRLGKSITPKFAPRYYDAVTLALRIVPTDILQNLHDGLRSTGMVGVFDHCVAMGKWVPVPLDSEPAIIEAFGVTAELTSEQIGVDHALSALSQFTTLKIGDVIMPCHLPLSFIPAPGADFSAKLNADTVLSVRIR